ncbi:MAG: Ferrous-iron efflux pump FieF [Bacteroidia bacterium]|nr:Ferrous-iron efflux pump FieF [Bacteroidia bacterium]
MSSQYNIRFQRFVLIISIVLMLLKFVAWYVTHSNAILTDALESIVNVVAGAFALWSLIVAARPKDSDHPYGHGKVEFLSAGLEGSLIVFAGVAMMAKAIYNFFYPIEVHSLDFGIYLTVFAGVANYITGKYLEAQGRKSNSHAMIADGKHLQSDAWSTVGLLIGLALIYFTGILWLDNVVAVLLGAFIFYTGYKLVRASLAGIMDEADYVLIEELIQIMNENRQNNWVDIHNLRVIKYGSKLHVDCHITLPWYLNLRESHEEGERLGQLINEKKQDDIEFFIHTDPCISTSCKICQKTDCKVRQFEAERKIEWKLENVLSNKKHGS